MKWSDISLKQFKEIEKLNSIEDNDDKMFQVCQIIYGDDVLDLPLNEFKKKVKELSFLSKKIKTETPPKKFNVNGREYYLDGLLGRITTKQFIDFQNHSKSNFIEGMLSVFIIPKGHKYNDGYDMEQVFEDIMDMPITLTNSIAFFFKIQFVKSLEIFQSYLTKMTKKTEMTKEMKPIIEDMIRHFNVLV